jgi:type I restriction-modification system DNA methylase subunit
MDITALENWLWDAACSVRGPLDAPKYKDYLLPLLFYKRLSDVHEDELRKLSQAFGDEALARQLAEEDRAKGTPPANSADWGRIQHMAARLKPRGKMEVVLDTGAMTRGSGNEGGNKELQQLMTGQVRVPVFPTASQDSYHEEADNE